jgi:hypothetical protein
MLCLFVLFRLTYLQAYLPTFRLETYSIYTWIILKKFGVGL